MDNLRLSRDNPWPGLASYDEASAAFFLGREAEREELLRLIHRAPVAVLYGQSGLGKTSLLQAGAFPCLRQEDLLPVYIRLDFGADSPELETQVRDLLLHALAQAGGEASAAPEAGESLWAWLHRKDLDLWSARNRLLTPLLAFDQFEELFALGRGVGSEKKRAFLALLACLAENRAPAPLQAQAERDPALLERYDFRKRPCRLLFAFREDFLPDFEGLRRLMPSIAHHRLRLLPMDGEQALAAVRQGGQQLVTAEAAASIVAFAAARYAVEGAAEDGAGLSLSAEENSASSLPLPAGEGWGEGLDTRPNAPANKDPHAAKEGQPSAVDALLSNPAALSIEPALLSLICAELNRLRQEQGQAQISADLAAAAQDSIIADFYQRSFAGLDPAAQVFVEDHLLTRAGYRDSRALEDAQQLPGLSLAACAPWLPAACCG
jgi:hypothetical protein